MSLVAVTPVPAQVDVTGSLLGNAIVLQVLTAPRDDATPGRPDERLGPVA